MKVAIVGGGVVGLTTALQLQRELRNAEVCVFASDFDRTVSHVAAGIFRVGSSYSGPTEQITREWIRDSYEYYDDIRKSPDASFAGVTSISGYMFANSSPETVKSHWIENLVPIYRQASEEEFQLVGGSWKYGSFLTTLLTNCKLYLPWARRKLQETGTKLTIKKLDSLTELIPEWNLIINCTGLGARSLCNDRRLVSIRGQVIKVKAPWMKTFFYGELDTYIIPGFNGVVTLGGSRSFHSENMNLCPYESMAIRDRCEKLVPALKKASVLREEVGLRPHRENNVRVEAEHIINGLSKAIVIHNYGHSGYGVCTAPGTAKYAVQLAKEMHKSSIAKL
ncbi:PREDICTED: D-aspartate oxidase [Dufourea novaeangliae]|uniref:D-aspartate oxidase n=1 Tax=Dufourea novaeangliae TaxID=178035 RepID=A0A154PG51_DUFNO|nr:PREDICTED: D-aspartate oxidase [Dufourea novaeangliae]KZC10767.1 D-aspartate oxidase [Dufourea novaeangliae]